MKTKEISLGSREAIEAELRADEEMLRELGALKEEPAASEAPETEETETNEPPQPND